MTNLAELHPLVAALREEMLGDDELTQATAAEEIGVSIRTVQNWLLTDTTPQKRHRPLLRVWLERRAA